jgi:hypothetical protein
MTRRDRHVGSEPFKTGASLDRERTESSAPTADGERTFNPKRVAAIHRVIASQKARAAADPASGEQRRLVRRALARLRRRSPEKR